MYLSAEATAYKTEVTLLVKLAAEDAGFVITDDDFLGWSMVIIPPNRRSDVDGGIKLTQDAIADALGINDKRFSEVRVQRLAPDKTNPIARITIYTCEETK